MLRGHLCLGPDLRGNASLLSPMSVKFRSEFFIDGFCFVKVASFWASQVVLVVKSPPTNAGDIRDSGSIPGLGRSSGEGHGKPLQYFCLKNPHGQRCLGGHKELDMTKAT